MPLVALAQSWNAPEFRRTIRVGKQEPVQITLTKAPLQVSRAELAALKKANVPLVEVDPTRVDRMTKAAQREADELAAERQLLEAKETEPSDTAEPIGGVEAVVTGEASDAEG